MNKVIYFLIFTFSIPSFAEMSAKDIMDKNEDVRRVSDIVANSGLYTGVRTSPRVKKFTWWRKLTADKIHFNTFTKFHEPSEIKNEAILFLEHENDDSDVLMYLPVYKKVRRVERSNQSGSFMGSEFSYADIATPHADDYSFKLIKTEKCPHAIGANVTSGASGNSEDCWVIESIPKRDETRERTGYSKSVQWIAKTNFMMDHAEHYDLKEQLWKKVNASDIKEVDPTLHKWFSHHIEVDNLKNGKFTLLEFKNVKVNRGINDAVFTQQNLSK